MGDEKKLAEQVNSGVHPHHRYRPWTSTERRLARAYLDLLEAIEPMSEAGPYVLRTMRERDSLREQLATARAEVEDVRKQLNVQFDAAVQAEAEVERLRGALEWYLEQYPCGGVGSGVGICASTSTNTLDYCSEASADPEEWCASGKFRTALGDTPHPVTE